MSLFSHDILLCTFNSAS